MAQSPDLPSDSVTGSPSPATASSVLQGLAGLLLSESDVPTTLKLVADLAVAQIDACDAAGVTLIRDGVPSTAAQSEPVVGIVDAFQYEAMDGPCLDAATQHRTFRIETTLDDERWRHFCKRASGEGFLSVLSAPLSVRGQSVGALNCYSRKTYGFDVADEALTSVFAAQASVAIVNAQLHTGDVELTHQLYEALKTRGVIERAKGILMEREQYSEDEAFETLRKASQRLNIKLHDIAREVAESVGGKQKR